MFVVPGSVGVQEASKVLIFTALGLSASAGMSVGLAFRLNEIVSYTIGLAVSPHFKNGRFHDWNGTSHQNCGQRPVGSTHLFSILMSVRIYLGRKLARTFECVSENSNTGV